MRLVHSSKTRDCYVSLGEKGRARDSVSNRILAGSRCHLGWVASDLCKQIKAVKGWVLAWKMWLPPPKRLREEERAKEMQTTAD